VKEAQILAWRQRRSSSAITAAASSRLSGSASPPVATSDMPSPQSKSSPATNGDASRTSGRRKVLLVSNRVMHYRVPVYNYFARRFRQNGWELVVRSNEIEGANAHELDFDFKLISMSFKAYKAEIERIDPAVVILFLHLRDRIIWPLVHWLKVRRTPVVLWTKAKNYDNPNGLVSSILYPYMHWCCDGLILYASAELSEISRWSRGKAFAANNTLNFESFPEIHESKAEIKKQLGVPFRKVVLSVGRMGAGGGRKRLDHLLEVFREIETPGVGLVIVGSGLSPELAARMNRANTMYLGEVHDREDIAISRIFKMADLFSVPGHIGLGINQAFYWGLPVVTEAVAQPPEIHYLVHGRNGFMVPADDLGALRGRILELLNDDDKCEEFSRNARHDILTNASIERMFQGFLDSVTFVTK
jgi:glycosyltransferase involved in cell wall biosynthesis